MAALIDGRRATIHYDYLRPQKAETLTRWHNWDFEERDELHTWLYPNATILPLKTFEGDNLLFGRGGVVDERGEYVAESAIDKRMQGAYAFDHAQVRDEKVVFCGYLVKHWGHFLIEAVARLWYFNEHDDSIDKYVFFTAADTNYELKGNYLEFFRLLGILDKLEIINTPTTYREVVIPELGYRAVTYFSEKYNNIFHTIADNIVPDPSWKPADKVFLSRGQLNKAAMFECGHDMLDNYFAANGYLVAAPETLSLSYMIYLIRHASVCAAVSGTLPHNMLFGKDGQKLIILEKNVINNEIQVNINHIKKLDATYIDANIAIYSVNIGHGPFIMAYNAQMEAFTADSGYVPPDQKYTSEKYLKRCFQRYMSAYRSGYRYEWSMEDWTILHTNTMREAYKDALIYYGDYIEGRKPFTWTHYFQPHYIKQIIKRLIRR